MNSFPEGYWKAVEKYSLHYWFELESDWQLGEKFLIPMQFSTYPEKKIKYFILNCNS